MPVIRIFRPYFVLQLAIWITLLFHFKGRSEDLIALADDDVVVSVPTPMNSCFLVLVHNGCQIICAETKDEIFELRASHHDIAYFVKPRDSLRISLSGRLRAQKNIDHPKRLSIIWPKNNTVITSSVFDVHVFGVAPIPDVDTLLCIQSDSARFLHCASSINTSIISISLPEGKHTLAVYQTEAPLQDQVKVAQEAYRSVNVKVLLRPNQEGSLIGAPHVFIPRQFSEWMLLAEKGNDEPMHVLIMSARSLDRSVCLVV